jgi:hypothetical protein
MSYVWDPNKAQTNRRKHGVRFADAVAVFEDAYALTVPDDYPHEERFVTLGQDAFGRVLIVVYTYRGDTTRIISAREANKHELQQYQGER